MAEDLDHPALRTHHLSGKLAGLLPALAGTTVESCLEKHANPEAGRRFYYCSTLARTTRFISPLRRPLRGNQPVKAMARLDRIVQARETAGRSCIDIAELLPRR